MNIFDTLLFLILNPMTPTENPPLTILIQSISQKKLINHMPNLMNSIFGFTAHYLAVNAFSRI